MLVETAWPCVPVNGELKETAPTEVVKLFHLEHEIEALRHADASTCSSKGSASPKTVEKRFRLASEDLLPTANQPNVVPPFYNQQQIDYTDPNFPQVTPE